MPKTLYINDDMKVVFDERDFAEIIGEQLGSEAREYMEDLIDELYELRRGIDV